MTITCGACRGSHISADDVRACYGSKATPTTTSDSESGFNRPDIDTRREVARLLSKIRHPGTDGGGDAGSPATTRQRDYLRRLLSERDLDPDDVAVTKASLPQASQLIDALLAITPVPAKLVEARGVPRPSEITVVNPVANGTYTVALGDGSHVTIRLRDASWAKDLPEGAQVMEYLSGSDNEWDFTGFGFLIQGKARVWNKFKAESRLTAAAQFLLTGDVDEAHERFLELAEAYALQSGRCLRCNRTLTVPSSVKRGLGPECAKIEGVA